MEVKKTRLRPREDEREQPTIQVLQSKNLHRRQEQIQQMELGSIRANKTGAQESVRLEAEDGRGGAKGRRKVVSGSPMRGSVSECAWCRPVWPGSLRSTESGRRGVTIIHRGTKALRFSSQGDFLMFWTG